VAGLTGIAPATTSRLAMCCERLDGPQSLQPTSVAGHSLGPGQVRVRIGAAGVNFPDLLMTRGRYQRQPPLPFAPGLEAAGIVTDVAPGVTHPPLGARVMIQAQHGLFATEAAVQADQTLPMPPGFSMAEGACFLVAARTAHHALLDRAQLRRGETVLVLGAGGGTGLAAVEMAALLGARVIAAASTPEKLAAARARGAHHTVNYANDDLVRQVRSIAPEGVDVIFDPVGGALFEQAARLPTWGGRLLVVGFASGSIGSLATNLPLIKGYSLLGVRAGEAARRDPALAPRMLADLAHWCAQGHLRPLISHRLPLANAGDALQLLESRRAVGRIALIADPNLT